jgi:hypothetical protein
LVCANFSHSMLCGTGQPSTPHEYKSRRGDRPKLFGVNKRKAPTMEPFLNINIWRRRGFAAPRRT